MAANAMAAAEQATKVSLSAAARQKIPQSAESDPLSDEDRLLTDLNMLYLDRISTTFAVKDSSNDFQGQVRSTGIFLREEGGAETMQQLDLV